jgi:lipopolysaccharide/colanic/teichoic acid biosynthesis glycosyltransferase
MVGQVDYPTPVFIDLLREIQGIAQLTIVPRAFELLSWRSTFTELSGLPLIEAAPLQMSMLDRFVKRTFDLTISGIALVLASPILLLIGLAVALTSRGPILYRQQRLGRGGRPFTILKFRTMRVEQFSPPAPSVPAAADNAPLFATRNKLSEEERITRVGKLLRKTGLDELPQLWNVLTGAMSIVGPRPFISEESAVAVGWQARRYEVRPGITGLWQVSGRNNLSGEDLVELDYLYVASWSMWWDVKIMWDTPRTMLRGLGAY